MTTPAVFDLVTAICAALDGMADAAERDGITVTPATQAAFDAYQAATAPPVMEAIVVELVRLRAVEATARRYIAGYDDPTPDYLEREVRRNLLRTCLNMERPAHAPAKTTIMLRADHGGWIVECETCAWVSYFAAGTIRWVAEQAEREHHAAHTAGMYDAPAAARARRAEVPADA